MGGSTNLLKSLQHSSVSGAATFSFVLKLNAAPTKVWHWVLDVIECEKLLCFVCRGQQDQQLKLRDATIVELESKIRHLKEEHQEDRIKWQEKVHTGGSLLEHPTSSNVVTAHLAT